MGKIYEALARAGSARSEDKQSGYTDIEFDYTDIDVEDEREIRNERNERNDQEQFNFLRYSLGASSIFEKDRAKRDAATAAITRRSQAQPAREVTVDFSRLDPHLAAFYNFDRRASEQYNKLALTLISR